MDILITNIYILSAFTKTTNNNKKPIVNYRLVMFILKLLHWLTQRHIIIKWCQNKLWFSLIWLDYGVITTGICWWHEEAIKICWSHQNGDNRNYQEKQATSVGHKNSDTNHLSARSKRIRFCQNHKQEEMETAEEDPERSSAEKKLF